MTMPPMMVATSVEHSRVEKLQVVLEETVVGLKGQPSQDQNRPYRSLLAHEERNPDKEELPSPYKCIDH